MTKIVFWDYDGTLIDSEIIYKDSLNAFLKENKFGLKEIDDGFFYKCISGHHPEEFLLDLEKQGFVKNSESINPEDTRKYYNDFFANLKEGELKIVDNIDKTIDKLSRYKDIFMCITSSSFRNGFMIKSSRAKNNILNKYFNVDKNVYLCGSLSNCRFKPFPDVFIYAFKDILNKNNIKLKDGDKLFIVEDSKAGCEAGKSFKQEYGNIIDIKIIGYTASMRFKEYKTEYTKKLINAGADIIAKTSEEIFKIITD